SHLGGEIWPTPSSRSSTTGRYPNSTRRAPNFRAWPTSKPRASSWRDDSTRSRCPRQPRWTSRGKSTDVAMLDHSSQVQRHPQAERGLDLYETPAVAVEALLRAEQLAGETGGAAAGRGAMVRVRRGPGHHVVASDVFDYGGLDFVGAFLAQEQMPVGCDAIVTTPPFMIADPFVERALELAPLVIMLLRLAFLESERRCHILEGRGLARVHLFPNRLPMMHRGPWAG